MLDDRTRSRVSQESGQDSGEVHEFPSSTPELSQNSWALALLPVLLLNIEREH
jgi:hypothetical protein